MRQLKARVERLEKRCLAAASLERREVTDSTGARWIVIGNNLWLPAPVSFGEWKRVAVKQQAQLIADQMDKTWRYLADARR